jgi:hypothetical protein
MQINKKFHHRKLVVGYATTLKKQIDLEKKDNLANISPNKCRILITPNKFNSIFSQLNDIDLVVSDTMDSNADIYILTNTQTQIPQKRFIYWQQQLLDEDLSELQIQIINRATIIWDSYIENLPKYEKAIPSKYKSVYIMPILDISTDQQNFFLIKNLYQMSAKIKLDDLNYLLEPNQINVLHLSETPYRIKAFLQQSYVPPHKIFPAIKNHTGWIGCGLSYRTIIRCAIKQNLPQITICEDDCMFEPDFESTYQTIQNYLKECESWDIFVGCISGLPPDTMIRKVSEYGGMTFAHIDQMYSTVFNIYNNTCYKVLDAWNSSDTQHQTNSIDEYLRRKKLKIITTFPFRFRCTDVCSTIGNKNYYNLYERGFARSTLLLKNKISSYNKKNNL